LSNNLVQITLIEAENVPKMLIDKSKDSLQTTFPNQHGAVGAALSLNWKSNALTLEQLSVAMKLGSDYCLKALRSVEQTF
jgi:hypothetical protein